ncbi:MAG TPA: electron transfer flavoprotein subunit alpha, partial [Dehalococcoidia bacterium]|nr:electron transfer flavoprotein subunit alpha [Dehalococcoidia bacterium]
MAEVKGVLILGDISGDELGLTSREVLAAGRKVADDLGEELSIGLFGSAVEQPAQQAISYGADRVYAVTSPSLGQ